jgi:23S rRNA (adenine2503-C2)-methyltransferase
MKFKQIKSSDENVSKFVFENDDIAVESVLYKYPDYKTRTVLCISTQCGCPVGCKFCGTGKFFVRNLTYDEIIEQVTASLTTINCKPQEIEKFQIMFMSMGEPFLNYNNVKIAIRTLHSLYPKAQLLVSTVTPETLMVHFEDFIILSKKIPKIGLQFSLHESNTEERSKILNNTSVESIARLGEYWAEKVERQPFINYCVHENNSSDKNIEELLNNFRPEIWQITLSVICEKDSTMKSTYLKQLENIKSFDKKLLSKGYSTRIFNPNGQDDIGGGCGQLWYFQNFIKGLRK